MGAFTRSGTFRDRGKFVAALRRKIDSLKEGALRGFSETWEDGAVTTASLSGFGAKVLFTVNASAWSCQAELPSWIPIPQAAIEQKFDQEFEELKGL
jgi:hypothetical protein